MMDTKSILNPQNKGAPRIVWVVLLLVFAMVLLGGSFKGCC